MYPLIAVLGTIGIACFGYAFYRAIEVRKVTSVAYTCPYCGVINELTEVAVADFTCVECHRLVPIIDGEIIDIAEVRCGYCNALNYYSAKSEFLICEECDREIPIHTDEPTKVAPTYMFRDDDESAYELVLSSPGPKTEEVIACLQQMLALNRNQVKQMLDETPVTLLTGITKRKALILQAQLASHDAIADAKALV